MCNLYRVTKGQSAIRDLFSVKHDRASRAATRQAAKSSTRVDAFDKFHALPKPFNSQIAAYEHVARLKSKSSRLSPGGQPAP